MINEVKKDSTGGAGEISPGVENPTVPESPFSPQPPAGEFSPRSLAPVTPLTPEPLDQQQQQQQQETPIDDIFQQRKPDALIVAALMGNSIAKFNRNAKKSRLNSNLSAPPMKLAHTPESDPTAAGTSVAASPTTINATTPAPSSHNQKITAVLDRFKSFQHTTSHSPDVMSGGSVNQNYQDTKSSNLASAVASAPVTPNDYLNRQITSLDTPTTNTTKKNALNSSKLANNTTTTSSNSRVIGSKASKCTLKLYFLFLKIGTC